MQHFLVFIAIYVGTLAAMFVMFGISRRGSKKDHSVPSKTRASSEYSAVELRERVDSPPL
jgi:hypothetical protein